MISRFGLPLILAAFILLAVTFSVIVPLGEAPDEVPHWSYIQYLVEHHGLPQSEGPVVGESHQPPLYYLITAVTTSWIPRSGFEVIANPDFILDDPRTPNLLLHQHEALPYRSDVLAWHISRLLSIAMGAVTVWATWQTAREIFRADLSIAIGAAAFVAFLPGFVFISSVVNNDNLVVMLSSLSILQMFRMTQRTIQWRDAGLLGILLGLAALSKLSGFVLWPYAAGLFLSIALKTRQWEKAAIDSGLCFGVATMILSPWMIYNWITFGDPLAWSLYLSVVSLRPAPPTFDEWVGIVRGLYKSFWGSFGGILHLKMSELVYWALGALGLLALAGWVGYAREARKSPLQPSERAALCLFVSFWLLLSATYIRWAITDQAAGEARLLFPGLAPLAIFFATGLARVFRIHTKVAISFVAASLFGLNVGVLLYLNSVFAPFK